MEADDEDVEEEEYEEIEEEVEDEEEEDDDDEKEPSASPDVSKEMKSKGHKEHLIPYSFGPVVGSTSESKDSISSETKDEVGVYVDDHKSLKLGNHRAASDDKKDSVASVERGALNEIDAYNAKAFLDHGSDTAKPSVVCGKEVAAATSPKDGFTEEAKGDADAKADMEKAGELTREDIREGLKSSVLPQTRLRSLSPVTESNAINKRPAVICNFFAKGWCIKGSSCKFLHVKDQESITDQKPEGDEGKTELQSNIGLGDNAERLEVVGFPMATISSVTLERSQSQELGGSHQLKKDHEISPHQQEGSSHGISSDSLHLHTYKDNSRSNSFFRDIGGDNLKLNSVEDNSINWNLHFPGTYSTLSLSTPTSGNLPSFNSSRASFSVGSLDKDPHHAFGSTSLLRSSSPFAGFEAKDHALKDFSMDPLPVAGHRTTFSSDNWEPSIPFRPSFPYTQKLLSRLTLYDPIRDSIELPKVADRLPKFPLRSATHQSTENDPALLKTIQPEYSSDKHSISDLHKLSKLSDKDFNSRYSLSAEGETMDTNDELNSVSNLSKDEKPSRHVLGKDKAEVMKGIHDSIPRLQMNGISPKKGVEMGRDRRKNELSFDIRRNGEQRESKAMKIFRIALIDFIKELVRPTWLEGRLSKDAHKMVVKKAVEKVLSTVQPHQTPSTDESIQQYLSISEPKMAKLVQGYVVKYGKS